MMRYLYEVPDSTRLFITKYFQYVALLAGGVGEHLDPANV
jgi:hypothetical protein